MYAQLNRLLVGTDLVSLNMELKQDGRTVCCNHTDVPTIYCLLTSNTLTWVTTCHCNLLYIR